MLTTEQKIKLLIRGISKGVSESAGCNDGELKMTKDLIKKFFSSDDKEFKEFCNNEVVLTVAYGGIGGFGK